MQVMQQVMSPSVFLLEMSDFFQNQREPIALKKKKKKTDCLWPPFVFSSFHISRDHYAQNGANVFKKIPSLKMVIILKHLYFVHSDTVLMGIATESALTCKELLCF